MGVEISVPVLSARAFNILSDLMGDVSAAVLTAATVFCFGEIMALHLRHSKHVPVRDLGNIPQDFVGSLAWAQRHGVFSSRYVLFMVFLLALADFANLLADVGLNFVVEVVESTPDTVLSLSGRNTQTLIEAAGDPLTGLTTVFPTSIAYGVGGEEQRKNEADLADNFLIAADLILKGNSPFLVNATSYIANPIDYFGSNATLYVAVDGFPMAALPVTIPLFCESDQMYQLAQTQSPGVVKNTEKNSTALVPDCTFTTPRSTGQYYAPGEVNTTAHMRLSNATQLQLVTPQNGTSSNVTFNATERQLARDRADWRQGRTITSIRGLQVGASLRVGFRDVVLAGTSDGTPYLNVEASTTAGGFVIDRFKEYVAVANIDGACPPTPDELPANTILGDECFVLVSLRCDPFPEDDLDVHYWESLAVELLNTTLPIIEGGSMATVPATSTCTLEGADIVWGNNYVMDQQLVATTAGLIGRNGLNSWKQQDILQIPRHAALAALFSLGTLELTPSRAEVVRSTVNVMWIIFTVIPWAFAIVLFYAYRKKQNEGALPTKPWQLLVIGREATDLPRRQAPTDRFPAGIRSLHYGIIPRSTVSLEKEEELERLGLLQKVGNEYVPLERVECEVPPSLAEDSECEVLEPTIHLEADTSNDTSTNERQPNSRRRFYTQ